MSTVWVAEAFRTRGVDDRILSSSESVMVTDEPGLLMFRPTGDQHRKALVFICGSGVHPHAYAPLLRPLAESGHQVFIVGLPYRFAPLDSHRAEVLRTVRGIMDQHRTETSGWVVAGHSLGAAITAQMALSEASDVAAFVLIGTTHPKADDLSRLTTPFFKVYATLDGVAPMHKVHANRNLLPAATTWVELVGGNHSQFGHYGHQLFDGVATITREAQQAQTREVMLAALANTGH